MKIKKLKELFLILSCLILSLIIIKTLKLVSLTFKILELLLPVFVGFIYAWLINPLVIKLSKNNKRNFACISIFLVIILLIFLFFIFLVPTIYEEVNEMVNLLPNIFSLINEKMSEFNIDVTNIYNKVFTSLPNIILMMVKKLFKYLGIIGIGLMLGLYISLDYNKIIDFIYRHVPKKHQCVFINLTQDVGASVRKCINGTLFVAFFVFALSSIYFAIIKLDGSLLLGLFCGLTDLIPYIGPYIGGALAVVVGFTESKKLGLLALGGCIVIQFLENNVLQPIVMSKSIKISPALIIIGLLIFGDLFGIFGMIIATPILATIIVILKYFPIAKEKCKE